MTKIGVEEGLIFTKQLVASLAFSLLGWLVSWWNLSLVGVVFICCIYSWKVTYEKVVKLQKEKTKHFFKNEKHAIQEILEDIPKWVFFPDIERVEWINKIALQLWPDVTSYVRNFLENTLEAKIQASLSSKLRPFRFKKIDLGDQPPRITGVKVYTHHVGDDEIIIDMDVFYAGDMAVGIKISQFEAGVKDIQLKGTLRLILKPILRQPPFVGGIQLYFLTNPTLNFALTDVARVLEIPGLHALLTATILTQIGNYLILPNKLIYCLSSSVQPAQLLHTEPKGVLRVHLVEAKNLRGHDLTTKSDPYVKMTVASECYSSKVIMNCHNPVWKNEIHHFTVMELDGVDLQLQLFDKDDTSNDDLLGRINVSLKSVAEQGHIDIWRDLADKEGSVHFICTWYDLKPWTPPETGSADGDLHNPAAILSVFVESAKNLEIIEETEPSTVVTLTVGAQEQCTKSVLSTPNPSYDENFHFRLNRFNLLESLTLKVCDVDSDDILGIVCKPLPSIINSPGMSVHRPHALIGGAGVSELNLRASIKYLVEPDALNEPRAGDRTDSTGSSEDLEGIEMREPDPLPTPPSPEESGTSLRKRLVEGRTEVDLEECNNPETSTRTNMGEVELTFAYDKSKQVLSITVLRCRELLTSDSSAEPPSAYVKLYLLPEKSRKYKSEVFKDSFYPEFNEKFECPVAQEELSSHSLEVTVKHYESLFSRKEIGQVEIPLTNMAANNSLTKWYPLQRHDD